MPDSEVDFEGNSCFNSSTTWNCTPFLTNDRFYKIGAKVTSIKNFFVSSESLSRLPFFKLTSSSAFCYGAMITYKGYWLWYWDGFWIMNDLGWTSIKEYIISHYSFSGHHSFLHHSELGPFVLLGFLITQRTHLSPRKPFLTFKKL